MKNIFQAFHLQAFLEGLILGLLALSIYLFTINEQTRVFALPILLVILLTVGSIYMFYIRIRSKKIDIHEKKTFQILVFASISPILLWVGTTGWFLSPFFYLLYLVAISLAFLFNTSAVFSFIIVLIAILLPQIGGVNAQLDLVSLASLLFIIPLSFFLRREYLLRVEKEKKILILERDHNDYQSKVEEVLANKVVNLGAQLREPINDIRQIALYAEKNGIKEDEKAFNKIIISTARAFDVLKEFEEETTGKILVRTPKQ